MVLGVIIAFGVINDATTARCANGISALQLQKQLAFGSYKTAWLLAAKLRRAMTAPDRGPLAGIVEIDETTLPLRGKDEPLTGGGGRSRQGKMLLAGAVEIDGDGPGRIRLGKIENFSAASLHGFVAANVAQGATIKTDGWAAYPGAPGVDHDPHPKIRDTIFVHANSSGWKGDLQPFLCLGAGAAGALCLATTVSIASPGFLGRSGRGSTAHTIKLAPAKARMPHS